MQLRHEYKFYLNYLDYTSIKSRLNAVMRTDTHVSGDGKYHIRSLYFDSPSDRALREKADGVCNREKFRIRCYNGNHDFIRLEKKLKRAGLGTKLSARLTEEETQRIIDGDIDFMKDSPQAVTAELYGKMKFQQLRPKTIVDYTREPFIYDAGNVRVTLDYDIRTGLGNINMLDPDVPTVPTNPGLIILEVKYDNFLPDVIRDIVQMQNREVSAFSKYMSCRKFY
ncbi:MAG: polyphosphate polymerase domain-containing protein [Oscillospiraceae bacterium]|nr:polyphosphate polymerase domain-containing protein [Oscillospiraceae bacterium]